MQSLIYTAPGKLEWQERPALALAGDLEAIVRPIASTTCDLDRRILAGATPFAPPFAIGHEAVGEVLAVGDKVRRVHPGDIVVVPWHINCGVCGPCRAGMPAHCEAHPGLSGYGVSIGGDWGGLFSEEVRVPYADAMLQPLPDGVDPVAVASASDNLTDAYIGVTTGLARHPGAPVLVMSGVESLGLFAAEHALAAGARHVDFVDADERRREAARELGARPHLSIQEAFTRRFPVVIGATRDEAALRSAILCLAPGGHLSNLAILLKDPEIPYWDMYLRGVSMSFGLPNVGPHIPKVLELARCGHIHPERLVTLYDARDAVSVLLEPAIKPVLVRDKLLGP
ncbi:MAG: alcohol dehydrogenase [Alphaproteobacteria bacterium HGW-Alphaproteobacteria-11]|nr:MAG: alcohol dehydrogenase [Alphaproteobacteria bacterium HGW-Alphaproteobacteria-11]